MLGDSSISSREMHSQNAFLSIVAKDLDNSILFIDEHLLKTFSPIIQTEGIEISIKDEQLKKAYDSIIVTDDGKFICFNEVHQLNAPFSILQTELGIDT